MRGHGSRAACKQAGHDGMKRVRSGVGDDILH